MICHACCSCTYIHVNIHWTNVELLFIKILSAHHTNVKSQASASLPISGDLKYAPTNEQVPPSPSSFHHFIHCFYSPD